MMLGISTTEKQVEELMNQAWASLPGSQYKILKDVALARLQDVKKGNSAPQAMTPVPEVEEQEVSDGSQAKGSEEDIPF